MKIKDINKYLPFLMLFLLSAQMNAQNIKTYDSFDSYEHLLHKENDTTYIVNFWATWCAPCVKEMPAFKKAYNEYEDKKVQFIMTSMDFGGDVETRVKLFLDKHKIPQGMTVVILDDPDSNSWINKVNKSWSGAIPATLVYNKNDRGFYEKEFTFNELKNVIKSKIK